MFFHVHGHRLIKHELSIWMTVVIVFLFSCTHVLVDMLCMFSPSRVVVFNRCCVYL